MVRAVRRVARQNGLRRHPSVELLKVVFDAATLAYPVDLALGESPQYRDKLKRKFNDPNVSHNPIAMTKRTTQVINFVGIPFGDCSLKHRWRELGFVANSTPSSNGGFGP